MKRLMSLLLVLIGSLPVGTALAGPGREPQPASPPADQIPETIPAPGSLERLLAGRPMVNGALTLEQSVTLALRESPLVRGAVEEVEAAAGRLRAARAEKRPWLSANTFLSGGSNASIIGSPPASQPQMIMGLPRGAFFDQNLMLMYPLSTGGRLSAMARQAAALRDASKAELEAQRQEVSLMTRTAYYEVLGRRALVEVWQSRLREDQERLRVDQARLQQQQVPPVYVRRDEAEVAATRQELTNAERDAELALVQLKTVMGISPASGIEVVGPLQYEPSTDLLNRLLALEGHGDARRQSPDASGESPRPAEPRPRGKAPIGEDQVPDLPLASGDWRLAPLLRLAERRRPELQAASQRTRGAQAEAASTRSAYRPQINIAAMGDFMKMKEEDPFTGVTYGLIASLPLTNGGQRRARIQTAEAERRRQEVERERIALQVAQEVSTALLGLRAAEQNIGTAQAALTAAQEEYRVALLRYQSGRSIVVEALDALAARVRAEGNVVQALFQYNVERDRLLRAVGELLPAGTIPPNR
jgi:outer membrane protein